MGRSQVLYNRTKGRHRNRGGQQQQQQQQQNKSGGRGFSRAPRNQGVHQEQQQQQRQQQTSQQTKARAYRPKLDENLVLQMGSVRSYAPSSSKPIDEDSGSIFDVSAGSSIDIDSMAATMTTTLQISQRLRIPQHVAQVLLRSGELQGRAKEESSVAIQDAMSYSVDDNKVRVASDGQVEVTKKPSLSKSSFMMSLSTNREEYDDDNQSISHRDRYLVTTEIEGGHVSDGQSKSSRDKYSMAEEEGNENTDQVVNPPAVVKESKVFSRPKLLPTQHAIPSSSKERTPRHANYIPNLPRAPSGIQETDSDLDRWLDNAMLTTEEDQTVLPGFPSNIDDEGLTLAVPSASMSTITRSTRDSRSYERRAAALPSVAELPSVATKKGTIQPPVLTAPKRRGKKKAKQQNTGGGEDLDTWLDSVIS